MIDFSFIGPAMARVALIAAIATAAATLIESTGHAQTSGAPTLGSPQTDAIPAAPLDERQPRRVQLPAGVRAQEKSELSSERGFDRQLRICRSC